jgi:hypothetical protein
VVHGAKQLRAALDGVPMVMRLRDDGIFETINHQLLMLDQERAGRQASPSAAVLDSQSVKTTGGWRPRGYDAGKK